MRKRSKGYQEQIKRVEDRGYDVPEALALVKSLARAHFDETIDVAFRLGVDPRHNDQVVRGAVVLPNGLGKSVRVVVFARGDRAREAEQAGADVVGSDDLLERIAAGWMEFDVAIATPDMMGSVGKLGRILGPRGLMPNPKSGTVTMDVAAAVREVKAGRVEYRTDRAGIVHAPIGKVSFEVRALEENFAALLDALYRSRPSGAKGVYVRSVVVSSTMGPGVAVTAGTGVAAAV